jgi:hypothetical protein
MMRNSVVAPADLLASQTINPYWDIIRTFPGNDFDWRYDHVWSPDWAAAFMDGINKPARTELCVEYTWVIPDPLTLEFVAKWLKPSAIEIGAGTGYLAWQLSQLGVDILAFDQKPPHLKTDNHWHSPRNKKDAFYATRPIFFDVQEGESDALIAHRDRVLFLCWPPMSDMALNCLNSYTGHRLVYIGESCGGCTASDEFFDRLESDWEEVATHRPIQWYGIHDWVEVYERKKRGIHALH